MDWRVCQQGVVSVSWVTVKVRVLSCPVEWGCSGGAGKVATCLKMLDLLIAEEQDTGRVQSR